MRGFLVVSAVLAACTSGPSIDGNATITVIDVGGNAVADLPVVSSADGVVLAKGVTDGAGMVTIGVAKGGEVTAYVMLNQAIGAVNYASETVFGVDPGVAVQLPVHVDLDPSLIVDTTVGVTLDASSNFGGANDVRVWSGLETGCMAAGTPGTPTTLSITPDCVQSDGLVTVTGLLYDASGNVVGFADASDVTPGSGNPQLTIEPIAGTTTTARSVALALPSIPADDARLSTLLALSRKGHAFGVSAGETSVVAIATLTVQGGFVDAALADSLLVAVHLSSFDSGMEAGAEAWTAGSTSLQLDGVMPPPPTAVTSTTRAGRPAISVTDAAGVVALDTYINMTWTASNGPEHAWHAWAPPPGAAGGTRTFEMPPVPGGASFAAWSNAGVTYAAAVGYNQADFAPADYRLAPEPYIPIARSSGERSYALIASHL